VTTSTLKPLDGIRVLDLTRIISGPYCTRLLADCGAEVIKIEPIGGEHMRQKEPLVSGESTYFGHLNAGKKSVTIDFRNQDDLQRVRELAPTVDIVVENFRPGVARDLGLDHATFATLQPGIIYCSISGFGQTGPRARHPAYAPILHALSGHDLATARYDNRSDRPPRTGVWYADLVGGLFAFGAIQTALIAKFRNGGGQYIDVSLMDTMINLLVLEVQEAQNPSTFERWLATPVKASDGYVMAVPITRRNFECLAETTGHLEWLEDERFRTQLAREENWPTLMELLEDWTKNRTAAECEQTLMSAGVPCARYQTVAQAMDDEHAVARGLFTTVAIGDTTFRLPNLPFQYSNAAIGIGGAVPRIGEHTQEILGLLGDAPSKKAQGGVAPR
jgi:crotonobetainyl-CoA:carnitine CoA-transferase CaiB-like acyl-CoA transferase